MNAEPFALGIPAAAAYVGTNRKTIDAAIAREELPARRVGPKGGRWSIEREDLIAWHRGLSREARDDQPA